MPLIAGMVKQRPGRVPERLMVRDICDGGSTTGDPVCNGGRRMIEILRLHENITEAKKPFFQFSKMNPARKILQLYREVRILHLTRKRVFKASLKTSRTVNVQFRAGQKGGREKRKSLNVIPMGVA